MQSMAISISVLCCKGGVVVVVYISVVFVDTAHTHTPAVEVRRAHCCYCVSAQARTGTKYFSTPFFKACIKHTGRVKSNRQNVGRSPCRK